MVILFSQSVTLGSFFVENIFNLFRLLIPLSLSLAVIGCNQTSTQIFAGFDYMGSKRLS